MQMRPLCFHLFLSNIIKFINLKKSPPTLRPTNCRHGNLAVRRSGIQFTLSQTSSKLVEAQEGGFLKS